MVLRNLGVGRVIWRGGIKFMFVMFVANPICTNHKKKHRNGFSLDFKIPIDLKPIDFRGLHYDMCGAVGMGGINAAGGLIPSPPSCGGTRQSTESARPLG